MKNQVKTALEIENIRTSGAMLAAVLRYLDPLTVDGISTKELDRLAADELKRLGGKPAFLGYQGFPAVICISVNDEVVHGIPGRRVVCDGDLVGLDFGVIYNGMITDGAITVGVGKVDPKAKKLLTATNEALSTGIKKVRAGARVGDISHAIEARLRQDKLGVIEDLSGHGVGHELHEEPLILNYGSKGQGMRLQAGMTLALEPMATLGGYDIEVLEDGWTIVTEDGSLAAQFEHTILVLEDGAEILTK
jgi:methionyl aminopeptidase